MREQILSALVETQSSLRTLSDDAATLGAIELVAEKIVAAFQSGHKLLIMGNGGSAADAQHMAGELVGRFRQERRALPAIALTTDTTILTAIGNDYGFEQVFARQIQALGQAGDVVIGLSTSGHSPNVLEGLRVARQLGLFAVGLTGGSGGRLPEVADLVISAPGSSTPHVQEVLLVIEHSICDLVEQAFGR
jgi:D-sedoheptulose 7-phosphate isomerase